MTRLGIYVMLGAVVLITTYANMESFAELGVQVSQPTINIQYTFDLGNTQYVKYIICASDETLYTPTAIIKSSQESKEVSAEKTLVANTCNNYSTIIKANYVDLISVEMK